MLPTNVGGAGARAETGILGRIRALLRGRSGRPDAIQAKGITPELIQEAADATDDFSGRELAKLVASMQASVQRPLLIALFPGVSSNLMYERELHQKC